VRWHTAISLQELLLSTEAPCEIDNCRSIEKLHSIGCTACHVNSTADISAEQLNFTPVDINHIESEVQPEILSAQLAGVFTRINGVDNSSVTDCA